MIVPKHAEQEVWVVARCSQEWRTAWPARVLESRRPGYLTCNEVPPLRTTPDWSRLPLDSMGSAQPEKTERTRWATVGSGVVYESAYGVGIATDHLCDPRLT